MVIQTKEGFMRRKTLSLLVLASLCVGSVPPAYSADELFDTKAAAQHIEKGIEHLKTKKYDAAIKEFEESVTIAPDAEAYYYLGYAYYLKGKTGDGESRKRSRENFDKAYELDPNFTPSKLKLVEPAKPEPREQKSEVPAAPKAEAEEPASKVFQGAAQPEQPEGQPTPPAPPAEQPKEQPPQPPEPPKPPQQPEQPKPTY
jgi:tetratricopeptide (TPR) repeat protein